MDKNSVRCREKNLLRCRPCPSQCNHLFYVIKQQDLYAMMRRHPERFPIITSTQNIGLSVSDQRRYSNLWYRQFGTSQALPVNDVFGSSYVIGSDVPYTN